MKKLTELYESINSLMSVMGAYGSADFQDIESTRVMNALHDIDSGDCDAHKFICHVKGCIKTKAEKTPIEMMIDNNRG